MFKAFVFVAVFGLLNSANAIEFSSSKIKNADGALATILLRMDDFGTYTALFRKSVSSSKGIICETVRNSYWEHSRGEFSFWSQGNWQAKWCTKLDEFRTAILEYCA